MKDKMKLDALLAEIALGEDSGRQFKLDELPDIDFTDDRKGFLFTVTVHRKEIIKFTQHGKKHQLSMQRREKRRRKPKFSWRKRRGKYWTRFV